MPFELFDRWTRRPIAYYAANGTSADATGSTVGDDEPPNDASTATTEDATGTNGGDNDGQITFADEEALQAEIDKRLKGRLEREKTKRDAAEAKARQEAKEAALAEQEEYRALSDQRHTRIQELEPKAELADALTERIRAQIEREINEWPAEVTAMAPGEAVPVLDLLAWVEQARPLAKKLSKEPPPPGTPPRPRPNGTSARQQSADPVIDVKRTF